MTTQSQKPWIKSVLTQIPAHSNTVNASSLGGDSFCLLRYALSSTNAELNKYIPPLYFASWGRVYHTLREKAQNQESYDVILEESLKIEDKANGKDWLRCRLVPLNEFRQVKDKIAHDIKKYREKLPTQLSQNSTKVLDISTPKNFEYIREKYFPEKAVLSTIPIRGRVDCIVRWSDGSYVIRDYKSGELIEPKSNGIIKKTYVKQLHAYALLTKEAWGILPKYMELINDNGEIFRVNFDDQIATNIINEINEKTSNIKEVFSKFITQSDTSKYCTVTSECCDYCSVKPYCTSYWSSANLVSINDYTVDIKGEVCSVFDGYSPVSPRTDITIKVGPQSYVSVLIAQKQIECHPVFLEWVSGRIPIGTTIYILSLQPTGNRTQYKLKDETVVCIDEV